jgi:hypothetical protein
VRRLDFHHSAFRRPQERVSAEWVPRQDPTSDVPEIVDRSGERGRWRAKVHHARGRRPQERMTVTRAHDLTAFIDRGRSAGRAAKRAEIDRLRLGDCDRCNEERDDNYKRKCAA